MRPQWKMNIPAFQKLNYGNDIAVQLLHLKSNLDLSSNIYKYSHSTHKLFYAKSRMTLLGLFLALCLLLKARPVSCSLQVCTTALCKVFIARFPLESAFFFHHVLKTNLRSSKHFPVTSQYLILPWSRTSPSYTHRSPGIQILAVWWYSLHQTLLICSVIWKQILTDH